MELEPQVRVVINSHSREDTQVISDTLVQFNVKPTLAKTLKDLYLDIAQDPDPSSAQLYILNLNTNPGIDLERVATLIDQTKKPRAKIIATREQPPVGSFFEDYRHGNLYDYWRQPLNPEAAEASFRRFFSQTQEIQQGLVTGHNPFGEEYVVRSPQIWDLMKKVAVFSLDRELTLLITGGSGTGKTALVRHIHKASPRREGPFVQVACSSLSDTLIESEWFGHEKGAFTSAYSQRKGRFELAHKGTIFLDEIGELTFDTQKKLLQVLQEKTFERLGGSTPIQVDTRVIASTNKDLGQQVADGKFREDLYYRLMAGHIHLPPLSERREEIPALVSHFLDRASAARNNRQVSITRAALATLQDRDYHGNIRELENLIYTAIVLAGNAPITSDLL